MAVQLLLCVVLHPGLNITRSILVLLPSSFFSIRLVSVYVVQPCSSIDTIAAWKKLRFILSVRSEFHMTNSLSIAVYAFASHMFISVSVDETPLPRSVNLSTSFRELSFSVEMSPLWLKRTRIHTQKHTQRTRIKRQKNFITYQISDINRRNKKVSTMENRRLTLKKRKRGRRERKKKKTTSTRIPTPKSDLYINWYHIWKKKNIKCSLKKAKAGNIQYVRTK